MSKRYEDYSDAYRAAVEGANRLGIDHGIRRVREFGRDGFNVSLLPPEGRSYGSELRAERVKPGSPS